MWIKAKNGNVLEVPESYAAELVDQGHLAFETEAEARKAKAPKPKSDLEPEN